MSRDYTAFTITSSNRRLLEIKTPMRVMTPSNETHIFRKESRCINVVALWDTGATCSGITKSIVQELGLEPYNMTQIVTAAGIVEDVLMYRIDFEFKSNAENNNDVIHFFDIPVTELPDNNSFNFLVGMDIITHGDFAITNANGQTVVSYRIPPDIFHIDYTKMNKNNKVGKRHKNNLKRFQK